MTVKPWITAPADVEFIRLHQEEVARLEKRRKTLYKAIAAREEKVWRNGGRARYLAEERSRHHGPSQG